MTTADLGDETYRGGRAPKFTVTMVNTGDHTCASDVGPKALQLRVTSGSDRVWSSADCAKGGADQRHLKRGVPYTRTITWNRTRSNSKCDTHKKAKPGTYVARLRGKAVKSQSQVFRLR